MSREAMLYERQPEGKVRCNLCSRRCLIPEGGLGVCAARKNVKVKLLTLSYARACSVNVDPIEKKPLFHFNPGSQVLSVSSPFCNFFCRFCCNWIISQQRSTAQTSKMPPESVVNMAKKLHCTGVSYTYTEPTTFFEWAYDTAKLAHECSMFNTFVTNGYLTPEAVDMISPYLDAATVDFKGAGNPIFYKEVMRVPSVEPIYQCLKAMKRNNIHLEVTNLIVPRTGDSEEKLLELARWIIGNLGEDTPMHLLRFFPSADMVEVEETPAASVEKARKICYEAGLRYVYTGNIPCLDGENTRCPNCQELLVERHDFNITKWRLRDNMTCPKCGIKISIKGKYYGLLIARRFYSMLHLFNMRK
ncbi:MAG: pyruvate formate lyase activating enzyme [Thermoproteota archaeon]|nr:pyruvate formate lyase activating enzyme [Thermoproteota archaeon]